jgi:hypothetical protein
MKSILSLKRPAERGPSGPEHVITNVYDALLPGRSYKVLHKVAEVGKVSLTSEFLLRLVYSVDGMPEDDVATFFDFSAQEMTFLLNDAINLGYISRSNGRVWTTPAGRDLFQPGSEEPQIFNVEQRTWTTGFDLISYCPQTVDRTSYFDHSLFSLDPDAHLAGHGSSQIPKSFKRHFSEICQKNGVRFTAKRSLYSIDEVTPGEKFSAILPIVLRSEVNSLEDGEADLAAWRPQHELEDRSKIVAAVGQFVESLRLRVPETALQDYDVITYLAPEFAKPYALRNGFAVERFQRDAAAVVDHRFHKRRKTIAVIGSLFTPMNLDLLDRAISRSISYTPADCLPRKFYWRMPRRNHWGATRVLPALLNRIQETIQNKIGDDIDEVSSVALWSAQHPALLKVFNERSDVRNIPQSIEVLLIPGVAAAVLVHLPGTSLVGHAVPIGFVTVDPLVVARVEDYLSEHTTIERPQNRISDDELDLPDE